MADDVTKPDRADRLSLYVSSAMVVLVIVLAGWGAAQRLIEVAPGHDIPVVVPLTGEQADLPLGPDGAAVTVDVETATVLVTDPAAATLFALWAEPIVGFLFLSAV